MTNTAIIILTEHFKTNPGMALGIAFMIMALAGIVTPQLDRVLLYNCSGQTLFNINPFGSQVNDKQKKT